jgi:hypothetical protein
MSKAATAFSGIDVAKVPTALNGGKDPRGLRSAPDTLGCASLRMHKDLGDIMITAFPFTDRVHF